MRLILKETRFIQILNLCASLVFKINFGESLKKSTPEISFKRKDELVVPGLLTGKKSI